MRAAADLPYVRSMSTVDTYEEIEEVLRSKDFAQGVHYESSAFAQDTLITLDGRPHADRRRLEGPLFHREALRTYEERDLAPVIAQSIASLAEQADDDGVVRADLVALMDQLLHRFAAATAGLDGVEGEPAVRRFLDDVHALGAGWQIEWWEGDHDEVMRTALAARDRVAREFVAPSLRRRRALADDVRSGRCAKSDVPTDLLMTLALSDEQLDEGFALREVVFYIVAATQTTAHAIVHLFRHLDEWFTEHPDQAGRRDDEEFLRRAANESLRLHSPHPAFVRVATKDTTLGSGRSFRAGERVALLYAQANRDAQRYGADAQAFDPDRRIDASAPHWGFTFGAGTHACIGRPVAIGAPDRPDGGRGTVGSLVTIMRALYAVDARMVPDRAPVRSGVSQHDAYERFPIEIRVGGART